jgi:hypothetical protein
MCISFHGQRRILRLAHIQSWCIVAPPSRRQSGSETLALHGTRPDTPPATLTATYPFLLQVTCSADSEGKRKRALALAVTGHSQFRIKLLPSVDAGFFHFFFLV